MTELITDILYKKYLKHFNDINKYNFDDNTLSFAKTILNNFTIELREYIENKNPTENQS